jgi:hypothetical protein
MNKKFVYQVGNNKKIILVSSRYHEAILRKLFEDIHWCELFSFFLFGEISPRVCSSLWKPKATCLQVSNLHLFLDTWVRNVELFPCGYISTQPFSFKYKYIYLYPYFGRLACLSFFLSFFLSLKRIAKNFPHFYISAVIASVYHANIASISHAQNVHAWNYKKYGFKIEE